VQAGGDRVGGRLQGDLVAEPRHRRCHAVLDASTGVAAGASGEGRTRVYVITTSRSVAYHEEDFPYGHNKWICGSEYGMYVWERLHVHGRRISGRARRRRKLTDSHPFIKKSFL
jgi:hypothetical protein